MSAEYWGEKRQYNSESPRHFLAHELPLPSPYLVHVDPTNVCNFRCGFCPTGQRELLKKIGRPKGRMSLELFEKIMLDIKAFAVTPKVLHLYKDGEPLMHPQFPDLVRLAGRLRPAERINITTNAALLDEERGSAIIDAGIDLVRVSVEHVTDEGYKNVTETFGDYQRIVDNVGRFFELKNARGARTKLWVKILKLNLSDEQIKKFGEDFSGKCDECLVMTPMGWSRTDLYDFTLGSNPTTGDNGETPLKPERVVCPYPFYCLAVNFDGSVSVCCADWSHGTVVGNVSEQSLEEIWNGPALEAMRLMHLRGKRSEIKACAHCQTIQGLPSDSDLDADAERLIELFES